MNALDTVLICSACHILILPLHPAAMSLSRLGDGPWETKASGRQAAPTCYRDTHKARRIFLDPSNSFLLLSCPYWFGPSLPQCVPVVLIKHKYFIPTEWSGWKRTKKKKDKTSDIHFDIKKKKRRKKENWTPQIRELVPSTYLLQGHMKRPQHFPKSFKFFSASFMSWLIWFMPSSTRSSCSG